MKRTIIIGLVVLLSISNVSATIIDTGTATVTVTVDTGGCGSSGSITDGSFSIDFSAHPWPEEKFCRARFSSNFGGCSLYCSGFNLGKPQYICTRSGSSDFTVYDRCAGTDRLTSNGVNLNLGLTSFTFTFNPYIDVPTGNKYLDGSSTGHFIFYVDTLNTGESISGDICNIDWVKLQYYNLSGGYEYMDYLNTTGASEYEFLDLYNDSLYRLNFSNGHTYEFASNVTSIYNYIDLCELYELNLLDNCANLLIDPTTSIFRDTSELIYYGNDNPVQLQIGTTVNESDFLDIIIWTCDGAVMYSDYVETIEKDLYHPSISWNMDVHVIDDNTGADISGAQVALSQNCYIGDAPPNTLTYSGHAHFTGLSNNNMGISVTKTGYNIYSNTITVGSIFNCWSSGGRVTISLNATTGNSTDDFNNGTHDDTPADGEGEETLPDNHAWGCGVYFKNTDGKIVGSILDTDAYVDMYYWTKGCDATLKFQSQIYTYWYTDLEYSVSNNTYEYRRILNANFSDHTNSYRGFIYNETCDCNDIQILRVLNETYEEETHYKNLTSHCWIWDKLSGNEIDYRSDVKCVIYANSTNSTLLDITANFMNGTTLVDSKVLNWADFVSGSPKWYYTWYPDYDYTTGYNYTLNITGFNDYQLDTDEVWTSDITGNELTVFVKDNYNQQIPYATIFIEDWGSIATGTHNYATVTGLSDGDYQYKATKSGYISSGWATITLTEHESVTCILIALEETSVIGRKMSDKDIKSMFIPMMYILFIFMLLGAFMYANR